MPPRNEPARPSAIVAQIDIGSRPGTARRARAPMINPESARARRKRTRLMAHKTLSRRRFSALKSGAVRGLRVFLCGGAALAALLGGSASSLAQALVLTNDAPAWS